MLFSRNHHVLFNVVAFLCCITGGALTNGNAKRNGARNNYQLCLESFDVHNDKIIRTQDSREMGALYLNVTDVDSREECLKFCCDTEHCDVFIFEEKKPGSCYLFQCGPLYDFKCKFTTHGNYSSAVRTNYNGRSNPPVEEVVQISQQEHELKSLRKPVDSVPVEYQYTEAPLKPITTSTSPPALPPATPPKKVCTINQYQCRSTGECIAIYNVCDGIAQCTDGSDEAADMVCPTEKPTPASSVVAQAPQSALPLPQFAPVAAEIGKYQPIVEPRKPLAPLYSRGLENNPRPWELPPPARQSMAQPGPLMYPAQQVELPQIRKGLNQRYPPWDYQPVYGQNELYNSVNTLHAQNNFNNYDQNQPHIFNHKGPGLMGESETDNGAYLEVRPYAGHVAVPIRGSWQENQALTSSLVVPNVQYKPNNEAVKNETTTAIPCEVSQTEKNTPARIPDGTKTHVKLVENHNEKKSSQEKVKPTITKSEIKKINHVPVKAQREHKSVIVIEDHGREHGGKSAVAEHLQQDAENIGLRPKGAVISLALGLTVTAITAALIACRLRVVKKRGRRGHGPYAHDADYLVNGMYL